MNRIAIFPLLAALVLSLALLSGCAQVQGGSSYYSGDYPAAIEAYKQAIKHDSKNHVTWTWLGKSYLMNGQYDDAIAAFKQALNCFPDDSLAVLYMGLAYVGKSERDKGFDYIISAYNPIYRPTLKRYVIQQAKNLKASPGMPFPDVVKTMEKALKDGWNIQQDVWNSDNNGAPNLTPWNY